ncbi:MAG: ATP-binding protein [Holosporaceae bacterium]|jgi:anti-sigma regulatory factor (Ser/Thr protein kinase)|nr:ATP-binding protein [Holosporaceae bacterium]
MLVKIKNNIEEMSKVCDKVREFCVENGIPDERYHDVVLILDEVVTNVISYAYSDGKEHEFSLHLNKYNQHVDIRLIDNGAAFNPLAQEDPDICSSIEERQIGGLGIFIVKQLAEVVEYSRVDEQNQLSIKIAIHNRKENDHGN